MTRSIRRSVGRSDDRSVCHNFHYTLLSDHLFCLSFCCANFAWICKYLFLQIKGIVVLTMTHWYHLSFECDGGRADRGKRSVEEMLRISTRTGPDVWIVSVINCWMGNSWVIWLCWFGWFGGCAAVYLEMDYRCWYEPSLTNAPIGQMTDRSTKERSTHGEVK